MIKALSLFYRLPRLTALAMLIMMIGGLGSMLFGDFHWAVLAVCLLAGWVVSAGVRDILDKTRHKGLLKGVRSLAPSYWGMQLAHFGLVVCALGVVLTSQQSDERDLRLAPGESLQLGGYNFIFDGAKHFDGPNFTSDKGTIRVFDGDKQIATLDDQIRQLIDDRQVVGHGLGHRFALLIAHIAQRDRLIIRIHRRDEEVAHI